MGHQPIRLLRTSVIVRGLDAGGATRPLGNALAILGFGCAAIAGFRGCYPIRIRLGDSSISSMRIDHSGAIGTLGYDHSIRSLRGATVAGLSSGHTVRVLMGDRGIAGVRIDGNGSLPIAANGPTTRVLYAICCK